MASFLQKQIHWEDFERHPATQLSVQRLHWEAPTPILINTPSVLPAPAQLHPSSSHPVHTWAGPLGLPRKAAKRFPTARPSHRRWSKHHSLECEDQFRHVRRTDLWWHCQGVSDEYWSSFDGIWWNRHSAEEDPSSWQLRQLDKVFWVPIYGTNHQRISQPLFGNCSSATCESRLIYRLVVPTCLQSAFNTRLAAIWQNNKINTSCSKSPHTFHQAQSLSALHMINTYTDPLEPTPVLCRPYCPEKCSYIELRKAWQLMTTGWTAASSIDWKKLKAVCQWPPFSQQLMRALKLNMSGWISKSLGTTSLRGVSKHLGTQCLHPWPCKNQSTERD